MIATLIVDLLKWVVGFGVLRSLWLSLLRWRIDVYGAVRDLGLEELKDAQAQGRDTTTQRVLYRYTFAIRNAENEVLCAPLLCEVALEKLNARFTSGPELSCGFASRFAGHRLAYRKSARDPATETTRRFGAIKQLYELEIEEMRGGDTWIVTFVTDASSRHVVLRIRPIELFEGADMLLPVVEPLELRFPSTEDVTIRQSSGERWLPMSLVVACFVTYLWIANRAYGLELGQAIQGRMILYDACVLGIMALGGLWLWWATRRRPAPFVQGYRARYSVQPTTRFGSGSGEPAA
jgi:hypothetical protein